MSMTQNEAWNIKYNEVMKFIESNKRNPSRYDDTERGLYCNWLRHNRKLLNAGEMRTDRLRRFERLMALMESYRHKNQYE